MSTGGRMIETGLLHLVAEIRAALGDNGKRMQPELMDYCRELAAMPARLAELESFAFYVRDHSSESEIVANANRVLNPKP
jgi:hypothetical protein